MNKPAMLVFCSLMAFTQAFSQANTNYDEGRVGTYALPDPLRLPDGNRVKSADQWMSAQRPRIYHLFEESVYGRMPRKKLDVFYETSTPDSVAYEGIGRVKNVRIFFMRSDTSLHVDLLIISPRGREHGPVFLGLRFTRELGERWAVRKLLERGYTVATMYYQDIEADRADGWQTGLRSKLITYLDIKPEEWGAIGIWAWSLSRAMDYLEQEPWVDAKRVALIGHSRLGKTALWAGASDPRFAVVISNESGEGGAALARRWYGETIKDLNSRFPYWFCPAYSMYNANPDELPVDQHMLLALMAPRPLYVASAEGDQWSDPKGEFLGARNADVVYKLFKREGVGTDVMPEANHPVGDFVRYHMRTGRHDVTSYDWDQYLEFADRHL